MMRRGAHIGAKPQTHVVVWSEVPTTRLRSRPERARRGAVAVTAVVLMILVNLIIVGIVLVGARHQDVSINTIETTRAFYGAEAAINIALRELSLNDDIDGNGEVGGIAPISPAVFLGIAAAAEIETNGDDYTITAWAETPRVHRRNELAVSQQAGSGVGYPGLLAYYHIVGQPLWSVEHVDWNATPDAMAVSPDINWPSTGNSNPFWIGGPNDYYGARFVGWVNVPQSGTWTFETNSDDGSILFINGEDVVDNDGLHAMQQRSGTIDLEEGWHEIEVRYFEGGGSHGLIVSWQGPGVPQLTVIPPEAFAHTDSQRLQPVSGVTARETISMRNQALIDAFDSSAGEYGDGSVLTDAAYVAVNSTMSGAINMLSGGTINGHARVGPGGDPDTGIVPAEANITGTRRANDSEVTIPQIILPDGIPNSGGDFSLAQNTTQMLDENFRYNNFNLRNRSHLVITTPVIGRVDGDFVMDNNSTVELASNGRLTLYVYGSLIMNNNATVTNNTGDSTRLRIFMMGSDSIVELPHSGQVVGELVAPESDINFSAQSELFGSVFCRTLNMRVHGTVHVDRRTVQVEGASGGLRVHSWHEVDPSP